MTSEAPKALEFDPSLAHLLMGLGRIEGRVSRAVDRRRAAEDELSDRFKGLYISEADVDRLLAEDSSTTVVDLGADSGRRISEWVERHRQSGADMRLQRLALEFELGELDVELLLIAVAPALDARFERLYGYLQDDITSRQASVGMALDLCGFPTWSEEARSRLAPDAPLRNGSLVDIVGPGRPLLSRTMHVPDRVIAYLLGSDAPDPLIAPIRIDPPGADLPAAHELSAALVRGTELIYLVDRTGAAARSVVVEAFAMNDEPLLSIDLSLLDPAVSPVELARIAVREVRLRQGGLAVGPIDPLAASSSEAVRTLAAAPRPVVLIGHRPWEPEWSERTPLVVDAPVPTTVERKDLWRGVLEASGDPEAQLPAQMSPFRLTPAQVARAASSALVRARAAGRDLDLADLQAGARAENSAGLERLARRVEPAVSWSQLVLPNAALVQLQELSDRARYRDMVIDEWGMSGGSTHGRGVMGLFAGDPGTGKTMSAEVMAGELGLDLYVIDLSTVVDKYIGETEKNLDRIFDAAEGINGVLLFDEADALFGKRSDVKDARDRYANVEIAYLLQRMERFDGLALLTTNLRANLDEAFTRRLDAVIDFPMPEEEDRLRLWAIHLPPSLPQGEDIDTEFLARRFRLSGGNIRNICLAAAYLAAEERRPVTMSDLVRGTEREYRKLGRLTVEEEFGHYIELVRRDATGSTERLTRS